MEERLKLSLFWLLVIVILGLILYLIFAPAKPSTWDVSPETDMNISRGQQKQIDAENKKDLGE